jgi:hypothetical protein
MIINDTHKSFLVKEGLKIAFRKGFIFFAKLFTVRGINIKAYLENPDNSCDKYFQPNNDSMKLCLIGFK